MCLVSFTYIITISNHWQKDSLWSGSEIFLYKKNINRPHYQNTSRKLFPVKMCSDGSMSVSKIDSRSIRQIFLARNIGDTDIIATFFYIINFSPRRQCSSTLMLTARDCPNFWPLLQERFGVPFALAPTALVARFWQLQWTEYSAGNISET